MSETQDVERDERTVAVENESYKIITAFLVLALLADGAYRAHHNQAAWDLLILAMTPGFFSLAYRARHKALPVSWVKTLLWCAIIAAIIGAVIAFLLKHFNVISGS